MTSYHVLISGGGIIGKTLALALGRAGFHVCIFGANSARKNDPRSYALDRDSINVFKSLDIDLMGVPVDKMTLARGERFAEPMLHIESEALLHMVDHVKIESALDAALAKESVTRISSALTDFDIYAHDVKTSVENQSIRAPLLVIAEGKTGTTTAKLGVAINRHDFKQRAVTAKIALDRSHKNTAFQVFTPDGPLAVLPDDGDTASIVWSQTEAKAAALMALSAPQFLDALAEIMGPVAQPKQLTGERHSFPLYGHNVNKLSGLRFTLIGDAAHGIHPLAGQGLNLGLRDIGVLADQLVAARARGEDIGTLPVTTAYAQARKADIARITAMTRGIDAAFTAPNPVAKLLNKAVFSLGQYASPALLQTLAPAAPRGESRLARGESWPPRA